MGSTSQVELEGMGTLDVAFAQLPSLPGRQFTHDLPAFTQAQPLDRPVLLHLQHTIISFTPHHVDQSCTVARRTTSPLCLLGSDRPLTGNFKCQS